MTAIILNLISCILWAVIVGLDVGKYIFCKNERYDKKNVVKIVLDICITTLFAITILISVHSLIGAPLK